MTNKQNQQHETCGNDLNSARQIWGSHSGIYGDCCVRGCNVRYPGTMNRISAEPWWKQGQENFH